MDKKFTQTGISDSTFGDNAHVEITQIVNILQEAKRLGIPLNLPPTNVAFFAGRGTDLEQVHSLLQQNQQVAVSAYVKGMGGVGKTELAIQYALRHLLTDYRGGICWLQANSDIAIQLKDFVRVQLAETIPDDLDTAKKLVDYCWSRLNEHLSTDPVTKEPPKKMLVILDDVKDYEVLKPYLPKMGGGFVVLATTRLELGGAMQQYRLDILEISAAEALLRSFLPMDDPRRTSSEIHALCEWLGRLPLAIEMVGRYLARKRDLSIAEIQKRLKEKKLQQDALTDRQRRGLQEMTAKLNVVAAFDLSWQELSEGAQQVAAMLSLFALAPIAWQWVESAMSEVDAEELENYRDDELLNLHLLERKEQGMYQLHQLLREYFQFQLQQHPEWSRLRKQVVSALLTIAKQIPQTPTLKDIAELTTVIPHLEMVSREMLGDIPNPEANENLLWAFEGVARFYQGQGLYGLAEDPRQRCITSFSEILGADHPNFAASLNNLAALYYLQGKYGEAEPLYVRSLEIRERQLGEDHPNVAQSLNNLALLYQAQGKYSEAEPLYLRSLEIREHQLGSDHPDVAQSLNNLAELFRKQGKYSEAEPLYLRSLEIRERQLGENHPDVAQSLNNLAALYYSQGNYSEAEPLYLRSLEIWERQLGEDHPNVAQSLSNLAALYYSQGNYSEAEPLYLRSLEIRERQLGAEHPDVANSLSNLALLYDSQGKYSEAEPLYLRTIQILEKALGSNHPNTVTVRQNYEIMCRDMEKK
ncbi:MAG: tetratricopeptide repeat protein [Pseudanabaena sp.]